MSLILIVSWIIQELQRFFFEACAVAFGSLSWDAAHVELIMYRMNYPGVCMVHHCRDMDMGNSAWKMFTKRTERAVVSPQPVGLFERNKLVQGNDEVEPSMAYWSLNKPQNKIQLFSYYSSTFFFRGSVGCWRLNPMPHSDEHCCPTKLPHQHLAIELTIYHLSVYATLWFRAPWDQKTTLFFLVFPIFSFPGHAWPFHKCLIPEIWVSEKNQCMNGLAIECFLCLISNTKEKHSPYMVLTVFV